MSALGKIARSEPSPPINFMKYNNLISNLSRFPRSLTLLWPKTIVRPACEGDQGNSGLSRRFGYKNMSDSEGRGKSGPEVSPAGGETELSRRLRDLDRRL